MLQLVSTTVERSRRITNLAMTSPGFVRAFGISEMSVGAFPSSGEEAKILRLKVSRNTVGVFTMALFLVKVSSLVLSQDGASSLGSSEMS